MFARKALVALMAGAATGGLAGHAQAQTAAAQTTAGTVINNTASVTYTVNGSAQSTNSTTATFVVDRKINFTTITDQTGFTQVNLGQQNGVTRFRITNLSNDAQDFLLDPDQQTISLGIFPGTDDFNMLNLRAFVDADGDGLYDPAVDTKTWVDELAPDASATVFLVGNVPTTAGANLAFVSLHAIVAEGGTAGSAGNALVATDLNLGNADNVVDVVFADDDSDGTLYLGDIARNGQARVYSGYEIGTRNVALTVAKSARILSDGVNLANFKALPGAEVEYCLRVSNATLTAAADDVALADVVPAKTTYVPGSIAIGTPGVLGTSCILIGAGEDDDADDAAETDGHTANYNVAARTVSARLNRVAGGGATAISFRVKID